jgi:Na+/H+ antiporter NhaD/arsenite permease-like protein
MACMIIGTVQVVPLVIAVLFGLIFFVVVMFFSFRSRDRIRSELERERETQPHGTIGPVQKKARRWMVIGMVSAPIIVFLGVVAAVATHDHRNVPAWDRWLLGIFFWGTVVALLVRAALNKRRENRSP